MGAAVDAPQPFAGHVGVNLGGGDVGVSQERLHRAQVGPVFQQVGGKAVAQRMR